MGIRVGVIPAAGMGTRMGKISKAMPKELLPVDGKPTIQYGIESLRDAGIEDIYVVLGWKKNSLMDFLGSGKDFGVNIAYVVQDEISGLAKAIEAVKPFVEEPFVVVLGDNIFHPNSCVKEVADYHTKQQADTTIGTVNVNDEDVRKLGILEADESDRVLNIMEKPEPQATKSRRAVAGLYVFNPSIFDSIGKTTKGKNNEYQLTDSIKIQIEEGKMIYASTIKGQRLSVGDSEELRYANRFFLRK